MSAEILNYCLKRWPQLRESDIRRTIRRVTREEKKSPYGWTQEQQLFDILVRVTQIYEYRLDQSS